jgi:misacylated tRNA(Ala) deacylase
MRLVVLIYQWDSYIRELDARVIGVVDNRVFLDKTIFHPRSGGVDHDTGYMIIGDQRVRVVKVLIDKDRGDVAHYVDNPSLIKPGMSVHLILDWDRRYRLMRLHTAAHILSAIMYRDYNALITGGNISVEYAYDDYSLETMDKTIFYEAVRRANEIIKRGLEVKIYWLPREEAFKIPGVVKLASRMPPNIEKLRIVEIPGVDIQADGGPHVKNTREIGEIIPLKIVNKGRKRKRLYYTIKP